MLVCILLYITYKTLDLQDFFSSLIQLWQHLVPSPSLQSVELKTRSNKVSKNYTTWSQCTNYFKIQVAHQNPVLVVKQILTELQWQCQTNKGERKTSHIRLSSAISSIFSAIVSCDVSSWKCKKMLEFGSQDLYLFMSFL